MASPAISWLDENDEVSDMPTAELTVVDWLDLAATAVPTASAPIPTISLMPRCGSLAFEMRGGSWENAEVAVINSAINTTAVYLI